MTEAQELRSARAAMEASDKRVETLRTEIETLVALNEELAGKLKAARSVRTALGVELTEERVRAELAALEALRAIASDADRGNEVRTEACAAILRHAEHVAASEKERDHDRV